MKLSSHMNSKPVVCATVELRTSSSAAWQLACKNWPMVLRSLILSQAHLRFTLDMKPQNWSQRTAAGKKRTLGGIQSSEQQSRSSERVGCLSLLANSSWLTYTWTCFDCNFLAAVCCCIWMSTCVLVPILGVWSSYALWSGASLAKKCPCGPLLERFNKKPQFQ